MAATLMAHTDSSKVSEEIVRGIAAPAPTATWHPISHGALLDQALEILTNNGLQIGAKSFALSNDHQRMFGVFDVLNLDNADGSVSFAVGLRNSIDKTLPAGICFGARVFVCDNLAFSGEVTIHRRHTKNILSELPGLMREAVGQFGAFRDAHYRLFDTLKSKSITADQAWGLVGRAYEDGAITKAKIADVIAEYRSAEHLAKHGTADVGGPETAWSLYNAGTEVMKVRQSRNLIEGATESIAWHALFVKVFGQKLEPTKTVVSTVVPSPAVAVPSDFVPFALLPAPTPDVVVGELMEETVALDVLADDGGPAEIAV